MIVGVVFSFSFGIKNMGGAFGISLGIQIVRFKLMDFVVVCFGIFGLWNLALWEFQVSVLVSESSA